MSNITIECPGTGKVIDTGIALTAESLAQNWKKRICVPCPHCRAEHSGTARELFSAYVLSNDRLRGNEPAGR